METSNIILDRKEPIAIVTINRPDKLNALNVATVESLGNNMHSLNEDNSIRAIVLTGAGQKAFVAGADISEITQLDQSTGEAFAARGQKVFRYIETMRKPVIAAVNGFALGGGCELAMACHIRIAATNARFGQPEINLGIIPGYGGTQRLPRLIGLSNALHLLSSGEMISAEKALQLGLVSEVVESEKLMERAIALATSLSQKAPLALQFILEAVYKGMDTDMDSALAIEAHLFGKSCGTEDMKEGTSAFLHKRNPIFKGK